MKSISQESLERVLIKKRDILFVNNYVPHRGCENLTDYEHYSVHYVVILHALMTPVTEISI